MLNAFGENYCYGPQRSPGLHHRGWLPKKALAAIFRYHQQYTAPVNWRRRQLDGLSLIVPMPPGMKAKAKWRNARFPSTDRGQTSRALPQSFLEPFHVISGNSGMAAPSRHSSEARSRSSMLRSATEPREFGRLSANGRERRSAALLQRIEGSPSRPVRKYLLSPRDIPCI
jgi:hypothetical protein